MKLNRELQLRILQALAAQYPDAQRNVLREIGEETESGIANLFYLAEHHLVTAKFITQHGTDMGLNGSQRITAAGLDFLADDGGVSAMLGTITIKFHAQTLRQLIEARIAQAEQVPEEEKATLLKTVRELPADSIKHLTTQLLDLGMANLPRAVELIRTVLS